MNKRIQIAVLSSVLLGYASVGNAAVFYVKTDGLDSKPCNTWADACLTIAGAAGKAAAGDEIRIAKGLYKFTSTLSISNKSLSFIGGYDASSDKQVGDKFSTVISGDSDNNDTSKTSAGITPSYTNIVGSNVAQGVNLSSGGSYRFEHLAFTGFKGAQADAHGAVIFYANPPGVNNTLTLKDVAVIGNVSYSMGNIMAYASSPNVASVVVDDGWFENNGCDAGILTTHLNVTSMTISNSAFKGNVSVKDAWGWNYGVGAVWAQGSTDLKVSTSSFSGNTATDGPSAIQADGPLEITNSTFADNVSGQAAAIKTGGATTIRYSTIYSNDGNGSALSGGIQHGSGTANSLSLFGNLILANKKAGVDHNIYAANGAINDLGYNLLGYGGLSYVTGTFTKQGTTQFPATGEADIVVGAGNHGGLRPSVKIKKSGLAYNLIPNEGIPFYGVGKSADYPFVSLQQAHGALKRDDYVAGTYYFDLGGSYDLGNSAFTPGNGSLQFSTYVDNNGYVLIASADAVNETAAVYIPTTSLVLRSDEILPSGILTNSGFQFSEVRISSYSAGDRGTFDGYSTSTATINAVKGYLSLPNPAMGGVWTVTHSSTGTNYFTGNAFTQTALNEQIYHANGQSGIHWIPTRPNEALLYPGNPDSSTQPTFGDGLDLWVRSNSGLCDGSITTVDARGMPKSDRVGESEKNANCDVGAFEFNDYFKIDCFDEDGLRPEFNTTKNSVGFCIQNPNDVTPRALLDNIGAVNPFHLLLLLMAGIGLHTRSKKTLS